MKITNMKKLNGDSKIKAFFTLETPKVDYNDFKLIQGRDGQLYAMAPSKSYEKNGEKKFDPIIYIKDDALREKITNLAREEYYKGQKPEPPLSDDLPF